MPEAGSAISPAFRAVRNGPNCGPGSCRWPLCGLLALALLLLAARLPAQPPEAGWVELPPLGRRVEIRGVPADVVATPWLRLSNAAVPGQTPGLLAEFRLRADVSHVVEALPQALSGWLRREECGRSLHLSDTATRFADGRLLVSSRARVMVARRARVGLFGREIADAGCVELLDQTFAVEAWARPVPAGEVVKIELRTTRAAPQNVTLALRPLWQGFYELAGFSAADVDRYLREKVTDNPKAQVRLPERLRELGPVFTAARLADATTLEMEGRMVLGPEQVRTLFEERPCPEGD